MTQREKQSRKKAASVAKTGKIACKKKHKKTENDVFIFKTD